MALELEVGGHLTHGQRHGLKDTASLRRRRRCRHRLRDLAAVGLCWLLLAPTAAVAQDTGAFQVAGGYSFLGSSALVDGHAPGWLVGGSWQATSWLSAAVEVSRNTLQQDVGLLVVDARFLSLHAGPRFSVQAGRIRPFAQLLVGRTDIGLEVRSLLLAGGTADTDDDRFSWQVGAGVDIGVDGGLSVRLAFDHRRASTPDPLSQQRVLTALVYAFP